MANSKEETKIATVDDSSLALAQTVIDFSADQGDGFEGIDKDTLAIPFIFILQATSPAIEAIEGAKAGMFLNNITNELFTEVDVIPCAFQRRYLRWEPREKGGSFKGEYMPSDVETGRVPGCKEYEGRYFFDVPEGAALYDEKGKALYDIAKDTRNHFVLFKSKEGVWGAAQISFSSTLVKKSKRWMSRIAGIEFTDAKGKKFTPASYANVYKLVKPATKEEKNGNSWWSVDVNLVGPVTDKDIYEKAKSFHWQVASGSVNVVPMDDDAVSSSGRQAVDGDDLPF